MARATVPNGFVAHAVFLVVEREGDESGRQDVRVGACCVIERTGANPKAYIAKTELCAAGHTKIFPGPQKKVEAKYQTSCCGRGPRGVVQGRQVAYLGNK